MLHVRSQVQSVIQTHTHTTITRNNTPTPYQCNISKDQPPKHTHTLTHPLPHTDTSCCSLKSGVWIRAAQPWKHRRYFLEFYNVSSPHGRVPSRSNNTPTHALRLCPQWKYIPAVFGYRNTRFRTPTNRSFAWIFFFQNGVLLELTTHQEDYIAVWTSFPCHLSAWSSRCSFFRRNIGMQVIA